MGQHYIITASWRGRVYSSALWSIMCSGGISNSEYRAQSPLSKKKVSRRVPTATADGVGRREGTRPRVSSRPFRCRPRMRREPSAFAVGTRRKKSHLKKNYLRSVEPGSMLSLNSSRDIVLLCRTRSNNTLGNNNSHPQDN